MLGALHASTITRNGFGTLISLVLWRVALVVAAQKQSGKGKVVTRYFVSPRLLQILYSTHHIPTNLRKASPVNGSAPD